MRSQLIAALSIGAMVLSCNALVNFGELERTKPSEVFETPDGGGAGGSSSGDVDGSTSEGDGAGPGPIPTKRCDRKKPFGNIALVQELDPNKAIGGIVLRVDELEAFYTAFEGVKSKIRHARRTSMTTPWTVTTEPLALEAGTVNSLSHDALRLYACVGPGNCWMMQRDSTDASFDIMTAFDISAPPMFDIGFFVNNSGKTAYFATNGSGGNEAIIATVPLATNGLALGASHSPLPITHTAGARDGMPVVNHSETALYFSSDRAAGEIWVSRRDSAQGAFGAPERVTELDDKNSFVTWVSDDECEIYFTRGNGVHHAVRPL